MMKTINFTFLLILLPFLGVGQSAYQEVRDGNKLFKLNNYIDAENLYRESIRKDGDLVEPAYNLGNSLYRQGKFNDAGRYFQQAANKTENKQLKSRAFHNLGNSLLKEQKLEEGIDAYKKALINNPNNEESRYNLAYAQKQLQQQQQQQENQDQENKEDQENKDEQQDQQNQDQEQQDQENKDQQNEEQQDQEGQDQEQEQEQQQEEQQQQQQKEQQVSREDAKRILEALNQEEKKLQEKLKKKKTKGVKVNIEKDW